MLAVVLLDVPIVADLTNTNVEQALKPNSLSEFLGQEKVVARLQLAIEAAKLRSETLGHVILLGPPGVGKATLAALVAKAMGVNIVATSGPALEKCANLAGVVTRLDKGDVLFIDEIHRLQRVVVEYLVAAASTFKLDVVIDQGPNAHSVHLPLPKFTLVGTAGKIEQLPDSLVRCFSIREQLLPYTVTAISIILEKYTKTLGINYESGAIERVAAASDGIPSMAIYLLKRVRDYAEVKRAGERITAEIATEALVFLVDDHPLVSQVSPDRPAIPSNVRTEVWRRDGGRCVRCGSREKLEYDHIIPISKGGSNTARNIELLCEDCNRSKSDAIQ